MGEMRGSYFRVRRIPRIGDVRPATVGRVQCEAQRGSNQIRSGGRRDWSAALDMVKAPSGCLSSNHAGTVPPFAPLSYSGAPE